MLALESELTGRLTDFWKKLNIELLFFSVITAMPSFEFFDLTAFLGLAFAVCSSLSAPGSSLSAAPSSSKLSSLF